MQHYTSWNHYLPSINTNFSRQLNLINSCHITCLMLASQQVNIGLMPWFPPLQQTAAHADSQWWPTCTTLPCSPVTAKATAIPPTSQQLTLAASYWKYAPVGYIPVHFSADPAVSGPAGPSLTLSARSSSWWRPLTCSHRLGLLTFRSYLDSSQPPPYNTTCTYSTLVMGEVSLPRLHFIYQWQWE